MSMSVMLSNTAPTLSYVTLTSPDRHGRSRRMRKKLKTCSSSCATSESGDERWVAFNKNAFLDILNEMLTQSTYFGTNPEITACDCGTDWPTSSPIHSGSSSSVHSNVTSVSCCYGECDDSVICGAEASGLRLVTEEIASRSNEEGLQSSNNNSVDAAWSFTQYTSPTRQLVALNEYGSQTVPTDLTTSARRQSSASSPVCPRQNTEAMDLRQLSLETVRLSRSSRSLTQHMWPMYMGRLACRPRAHITTRPSSATSTPSCLDTASPTTRNTIQSLSRYQPAPSHTSTRKTEVHLGSLWMPFDKSLLCDVVDELLRRDKSLSLWSARNSSFCYQNDSEITGRSFKEPREPEMTSSPSRPSSLGNSIMLRTLLSSDSATPETKIPQRAPMTSSYRQRDKSPDEGDRATKRSNYAVASSSPEKRQCRYPDLGNTQAAFPVYKTSASEMRRGFEEEEAATTTTQTQSLKWKSSMLLRVGSNQTSICSAVAAPR